MTAVPITKKEPVLHLNTCKYWFLLITMVTDTQENKGHVNNIRILFSWKFPKQIECRENDTKGTGEWQEQRSEKLNSCSGISLEGRDTGARVKTSLGSVSSVTEKGKTLFVTFSLFMSITRWKLSANSHSKSR